MTGFRCPNWPDDRIAISLEDPQYASIHWNPFWNLCVGIIFWICIIETCRIPPWLILAMLGQIGLPVSH